ncbi:Protein arginine methyltransferase NDUFAF7, mitochondrial [Nymphon striatum]|nr:Protein arginine methyltransferase NDUFAF7, mitochondrial [Nymphon striatum]
MTLADYMQTCLLHPEHGYYATRDPFGATGDFITAPEVSQMFGELLGLCLAQAWMDQGQPDAYLAELGPGRGTLDERCAARNRWHPKLPPQGSSAGADVTWVEDVSQLPDGPMLLLANEFFDALPVRQFVRHANGWSERRVGLQDGALTLGLAQATRVDALSHRLADTGEGDVVELCSVRRSQSSQKYLPELNKVASG